MQATHLFDTVITMKYIKSRKAMRTFEMILKILTDPLLTRFPMKASSVSSSSELFISRSCPVVVFTSA